MKLKNHFIKPGGNKEIDQLKKNQPENIGTMIGEGCGNLTIAERLGLNKAVDKAKPAAVTSASVQSNKGNSRLPCSLFL